MPQFSPTDHPHRRFNPLTKEWVVVSAQRLKRPWLGKVETPPRVRLPRYDPNCYLCPGNKRSNGIVNPQYEGTYVFPNDFPVLLSGVPVPEQGSDDLFIAAGLDGVARVGCFSGRHDLTLAEMSPAEIVPVLDMWIDQINELSQSYRWVQIFENKGEIMGCSNPHPHCQIWGQSNLPTQAIREDESQTKYFAKHGRPMLLDYALKESERAERTVDENKYWISVVPYWAAWPYEILLLPKFKIGHLHELTADQKQSLADIMSNLLKRYDNLFETSFPYSMGWHGTPFNSSVDQSHWQLHAHFYPPLLRSATVKKFMVGYEMLGEIQRDLTAEQAAEKLRNLPKRHYLQAKQV
ncbi:MAG: UDP-glucose--hexose-1-phosphate uridylyltransferase [Chloroflexota bacterium]